LKKSGRTEGGKKGGEGEVSSNSEGGITWTGKPNKGAP